MQIYLAPWEWFIDQWQAPNLPACKGLVDLRSLPQCGKAGGTPQGYGLFVYPDLQTGIGAYSIGTEKESLSTTALSKIKVALGLTQDIVATKPLGVLWELLTKHADPTGLIRFKPLMPTVKGNLELHLGGFSLVQSERWNKDEYPLVIEVLKHDYSRIRQECLAIGSDHYKKVLDAWEDKYKSPYQTFLDDLFDEGKLPHSTTITESFNKADGDILGPDLTWTELVGDIDIVTNRAQARATENNFARAESALSTDDHYAQAKLYESASSFPGIMVRKDATTTSTFYYGRMSSTTNVQLWKRVAGVMTQLGSSVAITWGNGNPLKVQADGSTITLDYNNVNKISQTDTAIVNNLYVGLAGYEDAAGDMEWDDFEAADLAAGAAFIPKIFM